VDLSLSHTLTHTHTHARALARSASPPPSLHPFIHPSLSLWERRDLQEINLSENSIISLRGLEGHLSLQKVDMSLTGLFFFSLLMGAVVGGRAGGRGGGRSVH
jgi:hypothetical protein